VRVPEPFRREGDHLAIDLPGARVLYTTRRGGVSTGPYESLNLGWRTGDDRARVEANRERVAEIVGIPRERFAQGRQEHGTTVRRRSQPPDPAETPPAPAAGVLVGTRPASRPVPASVAPARPADNAACPLCIQRAVPSSRG